MAALQCEICGGKLIGRPGGVFECDCCGMQYDRTRVQEMVQQIQGTVQVEGTVHVAGTVTVEGSASVQTLLKRGWLALEEQNWMGAMSLFDKVLEIEPELAEAYLGKLMVNQHVTERTMLMDCPMPFDTDPNYQRILRFGSQELKQELEASLVHIRQRNEGARKNGIYNNAMALINRNTVPDLHNAILQLQSIPGWRDSEQQILVCRARIDALEESARRYRQEQELLAQQRRAAAEAARQQSRKNTVKVIAIVLACVIALIVVITCVSNANKNSIHQDLIGRTFEGTYRYDSEYFVVERRFTIYFVDEDTCEIQMVYVNYSDESSCKTYTDNNASYEISSTFSGVTFNWESEEIYHSVEPLVISGSSGSYTMYTENYNSRTSMTLRETSAKRPAQSAEAVYPTAAEVPAN